MTIITMQICFLFIDDYEICKNSKKQGGFIFLNAVPKNNLIKFSSDAIRWLKQSSFLTQILLSNTEVHLTVVKIFKLIPQ